MKSVIFAAPAIACVLLLASCRNDDLDNIYREVTAETEKPVASAVDAARFLNQASAFLSRLDDETAMAAAAYYFRDPVSCELARQMGPAGLRTLFNQNIAYVSSRGHRYILFPELPVPEGMPGAIVMYSIDGAFRIDLRASRAYGPDEPPDPEPGNHFTTIDEALEGLTGKGRLFASISFGPDISISCILLEKQAPTTVATFVALARGLRSVRIASLADDGGPPDVEWTKRPWYKGMYGQSDYGRKVLTVGWGKNPGFWMPDEFTTALRHDRPALLTALPDSPDRWAGAFGITSAPVPALDDVGTVFGVCDPDDVERAFRMFRIPRGKISIPWIQAVTITRHE